jgi:hypothetical protein
LKLPTETNPNLFALKGLVKGKFVISRDDDFVPVRLRAEPFVEFANFRLKNYNLAKVILYELDSASIKVQNYYEPIEFWKKYVSKCLPDDNKVCS